MIIIGRSIFACSFYNQTVERHSMKLTLLFILICCLLMNASGIPWSDFEARRQATPQGVKDKSLYDAVREANIEKVVQALKGGADPFFILPNPQTHTYEGVSQIIKPLMDKAFLDRYEVTTAEKVKELEELMDRYATIGKLINQAQLDRRNAYTGIHRLN